MTESAFFQDLAMLMAVAGVVSALFARLRWPKVLGYLAAGVLMSRHTWGGSFLADERSVLTIGQLGVVFLMFSMGLGFSLSQMRKIRMVALPTGLLDVLVMTWLGYTVGHGVFGWGMVPALFLGVAICDSATTMLAKVVGEMGWGKHSFVSFALGTSVCEDIFCVGLVALVTGVASGGGISLGAAGISLGGLVVFFLATIVFGFVLVPRLLVSISKTHDDEALLLTFLGIGFFVSYVAYRFEFSLAIGAFLVGILGAASDVRHRLQRFVEPLQSMFAAVFFVSIGLLVNPAECLAHTPAILLLTVAVIVGKFVNCSLGALATGRSVREAVQIGMSLAQIGEFAFMVALLYVDTTEDAKSPMYQIVVAVSLLTTLANPFLVRASEPAGEWAERRLPAGIRRKLAAYQGMLAKYNRVSRDSPTRIQANRLLLQLGILAVLEFAVAVVVMVLEAQRWDNFSILFEEHKHFVFNLVFNLFAFGLFVPVAVIANRLGDRVATVLVGEGEANWQQSLRGVIVAGLTIAGLAAFSVELAMLNFNLPSDSPSERAATVAIVVVVLICGWRGILRMARRASSRFSEALAADERRGKFDDIISLTVTEDSLHRLTIGGDSPAVGGSAVSLNIRVKTGATIVSVVRGDAVFREIGQVPTFCAGDELVVMGGARQLAALKDLLGIARRSEDEDDA